VKSYINDQLKAYKKRLNKIQPVIETNR